MDVNYIRQNIRKQQYHENIRVITYLYEFFTKILIKEQSKKLYKAILCIESNQNLYFTTFNSIWINSMTCFFFKRNI